jgi:hypothetical protein
VNEFRTNNIHLQKDAEAWKGVDLVAAKAALANAAKGDGEQVTALKLQLAAEQPARAAAQQKADGVVFNSTIGEAFRRLGGRDDARDFIVSKAPFTLAADGTVKAKPNVFSATKPGEPLELDEWLLAQTKDSAYAFHASSGGGTNTQRGGSGGGSDGRKVLTNPTPQKLGANSRAIARGELKVEYTT